MNRRCLIILLHLLLTRQNASSQNFPDIKFSFLTIEYGLPTNAITTVFKDSRGLMWFGSENKGLLRYDGKKVKSYYSDKEGIGISSKYVGVVCEDKQGWLWIQTLEGLYHLNPVSEQTELFQHNEQDKNSVASNEKPWPFCDSRGRVWISGYGGFQQFNPVTKKFITYSIPPISNPAWKQYEKGTGGMLEDSNHRLWVASAFGLYLVDTVSRSLKSFYTGTYTSMISIIENDQHQLLLGFWGGGMKIFSPEKGVYEDVYDPKTIVSGLTFWQDINQHKWLFFLDSHRLALMNPETKKCKHYPVQASTHKITAVVNIYRDNENRLWICSEKGLLLVDAKLQHFDNHLLFRDSEDKTVNSFGEPKSLDITPKDYHLSTWFKGQLFHYNQNWKLNSRLNGIPPKSKKNFYVPAIRTVQHDAENNFWYGTDSGLVKQTGNVYKTYLPMDTFLPADYKYAARDILQRSDGLYWARFAARGMYIFDAKKGKFYKNYGGQYTGLTSCMSYDKTGSLWLGTMEGLYEYKASVDSFVRFPINHPQQRRTYYYNEVYNFYFDEDNTGWLGTYYGLIRFNSKTKEINFITDNSKVSTNAVYRILEDTTGTLWLVSTTGLTTYNKYTKAFRYYTSDNGLPEDFKGFPGVFNWLNNTTMAVGTTGIITTFNPYRLSSDTIAASILFTDFSVDGKRIVPETNSQQQVNIAAGINVITIQFALLNYTAPQQNKLYYRILPAKTKTWIETNDGDINLINLSAGKYLLQVKGEINGDESNYAIDEITIVVEPYWYQTIAVRLLLILALCCLIYFFIRRRSKAIRKDAFLKQKITETEMAALKAQMNPHFMFNCINSIDAFIQINDKYNATLYLNKFSKLIRNVLDSSKQNTVTFSKDMETLKLYIELEELRSENKFITQVNIDDELLQSDYKVPPLIIQPFVENAIIHGLRNKPGNEGLLKIDITKTEQHIVYSILDNGIGRIAAQKINTGKEKSYGITMSYERIKLFNKEDIASVSIGDAGDGGTVVTVKLKII